MLCKSFLWIPKVSKVLILYVPFVKKFPSLYVRLFIFIIIYELHDSFSKHLFSDI